MISENILDIPYISNFKSKLFSTHTRYFVQSAPLEESRSKNINDISVLIL